MRLIRKTLLASLALIVLGFAASPTHADTIQLNSRAELSAGGVIADFPGENDTLLPSPFSINVSGSTLTFSVATGNVIRRVNEADPPIGAFAPGTELLSTGINDRGVGPLTIDFAGGVAEFGIDAQNNFAGNGLFTFSVFVNNSTTAFRQFTQSGNGFLSFLGARATGGDVITRVTINASSTPDGGGQINPNAQNNFAIGSLTIVLAGVQPTPVPEPATMLLLGTGLVGVVAKARRRRSQAGGSKTA